MQKRFMPTVKTFTKGQQKLLTIWVGCDCSSSTNPPEVGGGGLAGGFIGYWPWSACDEEVEDPCDIRALEGLPCGDSAVEKAIDKWNACVWNSRHFPRGIRLVLSNIHWKKLTLSCSCWSRYDARERPTRWFAESFITSTISLNFDDASSLPVLSSLLFLGLLEGMGWSRTGSGSSGWFFVGVSCLELALLSWPRSSGSSSESRSVEFRELLRDAHRADLAPCL